jgi:hypothetical protein
LTVDGDRSLSLVAARVVGDNPAGEASLQVSDASGLVAGDELFIQTTRGPVDDCMSSGAGEWTLVEISSIAGTTLTLREPLDFAVNTSDGSRHQAIRIPHFSTLNVSAGSTLTAPEFDGLMGGVLVFRAQELNLGVGAHIDMDRRGFRGGSASDGV